MKSNPLKNLKILAFTAVLVWLILLTQSCQQPGGNTTGSEYMPDMKHSIAYEANYYNYYYNNTWDGQEEYYKYAKPRTPVPGTVPRSYAGIYYAADGEDLEQAIALSEGKIGPNSVSYRMAGSVPYYYEDTEEERIRAMEEIIENPYPITEKGLAVGEELYTIYCGICHGENGDGLGYLVREPSPGDPGGKFPVQPANLLLPEFVASSNGRYYHSIIYGKNMMGSYSDKLSYEERWQVIHYIRSLQAESLDLEYNQYENTLNSIDGPAGDLTQDNDALSTNIESENAGHLADDAPQQGSGNHNDH